VVCSDARGEPEEPAVSDRSAPPFESVPSDVAFPDLERRVLAFWRDAEVFRRSLEKPAPRGPWVFYEGPPTANGKPGVHHVISRAFKDLFPRFKTMQGHRVTRKGGWDTHGLPVEIAIEQRLGFKSKQEVEAYGIARFNALCRASVFENIQDWNEMTERIGFWVDLDGAYVTYDPGYVESCWWIMKQLWQRGLLTEDYKTTWHSPSSNTTLASHEVAQGYREDVADPSVFPAFPAEKADLVARGLVDAGDEREAAFLAWTTTPWTLAANTGLAVHPDAPYAIVEGPPRIGAAEGTKLFVLAEALVPATFGDAAHRTLATCVGRDLVGARYRPLLRGRPDDADAPGLVGWRVVADDFVTLDDGTGVVHLAPAYGDLEVGRRHGLPTRWSVDLAGHVMAEVAPLDAPEGPPGPYAGQWFKDADEAISRDLEERGLMFDRGVIHHTYPFNWRDEKPLMNVAKQSWYIRTSALKDRLLELNDRIGWHPDHIRTGRFGKWLENNVDWALSRERYWGTPLPVWRAEDGDTVVVGSLAELGELVGRDLSGLDPHRPTVDELSFERDGKLFRRVPYTVDVWFESGAMPYAQWHYRGDASPPGAAEALADHFPADYICEAIDQTRGWFYSLHALATLLTDPGDGERPEGPLHHLAGATGAFKNVIVLGHIVDANGEKMSKSKGNVVDPWSVLDAQGADALRWHFYASSPPEATKRFSQALVEETLRDVFMTLWNTYAFFVLYANLDRPDLDAAPPPARRAAMDRWLHARVHALVRDVTADLEAYDPTAAARRIRDVIVDELSNWYVRRNRRRFWRGDGGDDARSAYATLHEALVTIAKLMAPLAPFVSETLYRNLVARRDPGAPDSVHLCDWPEADLAAIDEELLRDMATLQKIVELGRAARAASGHKTRQPLPEVLVRVRSEAELAGLRRLEDALRDELNVKEVRYLAPTDPFVDYDVRPNLPKVGKRLGKLVPAVRAALSAADGQAIALAAAEGRSFELLVEGEAIAFAPDELLLDARSPAGYAAVEDRGMLAALRTDLTPELLREGLMRDAVRLVQDARKQAGLEVADRIELALDADDAEARAALVEHGEALSQEVLATSLLQGTLEGEAFRIEAELGDGALRISLRRAG
jgi:isoleucyl-tRNA synthetase